MEHNHPRKRTAPKASSARSSSSSRSAKRPAHSLSTRSARASQTRSSARHSTPSSARASQRRQSTGSSSTKNTTPTRKRAGASKSKSISSNAPHYATPGVWTKDSPSRSAHSRSGSSTRRSSGKKGSGSHGAPGVAGGVLRGIGNALLFVLRSFISLLQKSKIALVVFLVAILFGFGVLIDVGINGGKAYPGVHIGSLDVSGKTQQEISAMVSETYQPRLDDGIITIYASEESKSDAGDELKQTENEALVEQRSVEEAQANTDFWTTDAATLGAALDADALAAKAYEVGRSDGGIFTRLTALFSGYTVEPTLEYNSDEVEALASQIDETVGDPRVDFGVSIEEGTATVTEGHDGEMLDRDEFTKQITSAFLEYEERSFIAEPEYAPLRIDESQAQAVCDSINAAIDNGITLQYQGESWEIDPVEIGSTLSTRIDERDSGWTLVAYVDENKARSLILSQAQQHYEGTTAKVSFTKEADGSITVHTDGAGTMPLATEAVQALNDVLFNNQQSADVAPLSDSDRDAGYTHAERDEDTGMVSVALVLAATPASLSFDDALDAGVISKFSSFTTEYSNSSGSENRRHNIHLAADLLNNSIVAPEGIWSFNDTAGERTEEAGFQGAGLISAGEFTEGVGGGVCQVATTVFNAVYEAGLPIEERRNHSLYVASYPAGRDAAVSWPDLDLKWGNDTGSDILVKMTYDETSVTCSLYGVAPGYTVETDVGEWVKGEPYKIKVEVDDSMKTGSSYVKTSGTDGRSISVVRTVTDSQGNVVREDLFESEYDPKNEVIVAGPDTPVDTTRSDEE